MEQYLKLLADVRKNGSLQPTRAKLPSTGKNVSAYKVFGRQIRFDLRDGFPLVTTKRVPFRAVVAELLWFISGSTNIKPLTDQKVTIWNEWADERGELGPVYGAQWRKWNGYEGHVIDQLAVLIEGIKRDPQGRRHVLNAWNVADLPKMALPPCHMFCQFDVVDGRLSCQLYQRSADMFLGVPFNIASYALFTHLIAKATGLEVGEFVHTFGNTHLYENHVAQADEQLSRAPHPLPRLILPETIDGLAGLERLRTEDIQLEGYTAHPKIAGEVAV